MTAKTAIIFGATGATGTALAHRLAGNGWQLFLAARNEEAVKSLAEETEAGYHICDATDSTQVADTFKAAKDIIGIPTAVVNCVGSIMLKPAHLLSDDDWHQTIRLNLDSSFFIVREAAKAMKRGKEGGAIALCSTAACLIGLPNHEAIAAAKAGVIGLVRSAAASYAAQGIRVNCVAPGLVDSKMAKPITSNENALAFSQGMHALGRIGKPEDIASALAWMIEPEQSWLTAQTIPVEGGLSSIKLK